MAKNKIVLAYSGGLDTTVAVPWLQEQYDVDVVTLTIDLGVVDLAAIKARALQVGAVKALTVDGKDTLVNEFLFPALQAGAIYEEQYPLATALGRPLIARRSLGLGQVYFLGIDYADARLAGWPGNYSLWELLLSLRRETINAQALAEELDVGSRNHPIAVLLRQPLLDLPSRAVLAGFLAGYLILSIGVLRWVGAGQGRRVLPWG